MPPRLTSAFGNRLARASSPATTCLAKGCGTGILPVFHGRDAHAHGGLKCFTHKPGKQISAAASGIPRGAAF